MKLLMESKIVLATWDWKNPSYKSKLSKSTNPYEEVYFRVIRGLEANGWGVISTWDRKLTDNKMSSEQVNSYLRHTLRRVQQFGPDVVIHDDFSFRDHLF